MASQHQFEIINLKKAFGRQLALKDLNLSIEKGSMNFLLGSNGSGKSTLLKCLAGHEYWDSGEILVHGNSRQRDRQDFNSGIHFISEDITPPLASLSDLKKLYQDIYENWSEETFQQFLAWSQLSLTSNLSAVSRGQKIQGLLALTLALQPQVLLIDEATAVLDPFVRSRLMLEIDRRNKEFGMTTIVATNIATEVASLRGRLLIMKNGVIVTDRSSENLSEGLSKIRVPQAHINKLAQTGFSYIGPNSDGSMNFLGAQKNLIKLDVEYSEDRRAITIDEVFILFSDRDAQ